MRNDSTRRLKLIITCAAAILVLSGLACRSSKQPTANKAAETPQPAPQANANQSPFDVKESVVIDRTSPFNHTRAEHQTKTKDCGFCHQRLDNNVTQVFPGHSACIECHAKDFTNTSSQMCVVCHKSPVDAQGTRISFPAKMSEFGVKGFSHKQHMDPKKMASETETPKCSTCHQSTEGAAASFPNHQQCYSCHVHQANQKFGECGVCHADTKLALKYTRGTGSALGLYNFKHGPHTKKASCDRCHRQIETAPKQVRADIQTISAGRGQRHTSACWSCHVQAKESVCTKCHRGSLPFSF
ncbi:MAG: cytochrome c3 family protein [Acidobacteriota bacterium]